jgi:hypothetical protein
MQEIPGAPTPQPSKDNDVAFMIRADGIAPDQTQPGKAV